MKWLDIGQEARGVVAIGQFAVGGFSVGMGALGTYWAAAMIGVAGRGFGLVLPLLPSLGPPRRPPDVEPYRALKGARREGWVEIDIEPRDDGRLVLYEGDDRLRDLRLDARVVRGARDLAPATVHAHIRHSVSGPEVDQLQRLEESRLAQPRWWFVWAAQLAGLTILAAVVWLAVAEPLIQAWFGPDGVLR